jgi:hypothetical protein
MEILIPPENGSIGLTEILVFLEKVLSSACPLFLETFENYREFLGLSA